MNNFTRTAKRMGGATLLSAALLLSLTACGTTSAQADMVAGEAQPQTQASEDTDTAQTSAGALGAALAGDYFTDRDLAQTADTSDATVITLSSGTDVQISQAGVYVISGEATDVTIVVDAGDDDKVQLVLDGASISNEDFPAIYVKNADKVFVTTAEGTTNTLQVSGAFVADGDTNTDAVIFSRDDLVLNGLGTLAISSTDNAVSCKDDLKVTGGSYVIDCASDALEANDAILIADGSFDITTAKDGLHAEDGDDDTTGMVYIAGGSFDIDAGSDAIQATTYLTICGGSFTLSAAEALEGTYVQVNDGDITISASDDGINASYKSQSIGTPVLEICGGNLSITMASGDTDALDSNGDLIVSGGTIDITAQFAFDFEGTASFTGGTITVNGEQISEITNSMMMGGAMMGGPGMGGESGEDGPMGGPGMGGGQPPQGGMGGGPRG